MRRVAKTVAVLFDRMNLLLTALGYCVRSVHVLQKAVSQWPGRAEA